MSIAGLLAGNSLGQTPHELLLAADAERAASNAPPGQMLTAAFPASVQPSGIRGRLAVAVETNGIVWPGNRWRTRDPHRSIKPAPGGAIADFGRPKVRFAADIADARPLTITTPEGRTLSCRPAFLVLANAVTGENYLLGEVISAPGYITSSSQVVYSNAFDTIRADIRYDYDPVDGSLTQDILLLEQVPVPHSWNPRDLRLECWTRWVDSEPLYAESQILSLRQEDPDAGVPTVEINDTFLRFGAMAIVPGGKAFSLDAPGETVPVAKMWTSIKDETGVLSGPYLIESVDFWSLRTKLNQLPRNVKARSAALPKPSRSALLASLRKPMRRNSVSANTMLAARSSPPDARVPAVVLDFTIVSSVPVPPGLAAWWPAGGTALDASTNHNDGTLQGNAAYTPGAVGQGFVFDGSGDFVQVSNAPSLNPTNGITVDAWVYVTGNQYNHRDIISKDGEYSGRQYLITVSSASRFRAHIGVSNVFYYIDGTNTVSLNTWYHVAMTHDRSNLVLYVNGVVQASGTALGTPMSGTEPVRLGGGAPSGAPQYYFAGRIDEPDIFDRALSATEIAAIYNAGAAGKHNPSCVSPATNTVAWWPGDGHCLDLARTNPGALIEATSFVPAVVAHGFQFDGSSDSLEIPDAPDLNPTNQLTLETWVYVTGNEYDHRDIVSKDGESSERQYLITVSDGGYFRPHVGVAEGFVCFDGETAVQLNTWYHVAMTYDGSDLVLYVNGQPDGSLQLDEGGPVLPTTQPVRIGGGAPPGQVGYYFAGIVDEPTLYNRALSGTEIAAIYSAGCAGKCKLDSDNDGLTDLQEAFLGTNPNNPDSDCDSYADGEEVFVRHTSPTQYNSTYGLTGPSAILIFTPLR